MKFVKGLGDFLIIVLYLKLTAANVISSPHNTEWLEYACKDDGTISAVNPRPDRYFYANVTAFDGPCAVEFSALKTTFKISNCTTDYMPIEVVLSELPFGMLLTHAVTSEIFTAHCNVRFGWYTLGRVNFVALPTWKSSNESVPTNASVPTNTSVPEPEDIPVEYKLRELGGEDNYTSFTIGYPISLELIGPPGKKIMPRQCRMTTGLVKDDRVLRKVLIRYGCTVAKDTMIDFSEEGLDYHILDERAREDQDPSLALLSRLTFERNVNIKTRSFGADPSSARHSLVTTFFANRYFNSKYINILCLVYVCPAGDPACDYDCNTWRAKKTLLRTLMLEKRAIPQALQEARPNWNMKQYYKDQMSKQRINPRRESHIKKRRTEARRINNSAMSGFNFGQDDSNFVQVAENGTLFLLGRRTPDLNVTDSGDSPVAERSVILQRIVIDSARSRKDGQSDGQQDAPDSQSSPKAEPWDDK